MAKLENIAPAIIDGLRAGTRLPDDRLEALRRFTTEVIRTRGDVADTEVARFLDAGFTQRNALEVILAVAMKVMTHYTSQLTRTPLDGFMAGNEWVKPGTAR